MATMMTRMTIVKMTTMMRQRTKKISQRTAAVSPAQGPPIQTQTETDLESHMN